MVTHSLATARGLKILVPGSDSVTLPVPERTGTY